ncbi:hypothetical protein [Serinibacter arcticus]|uniref:Uncharacterized protein n=1 Tax=Serinibacter arcticus TaxID=1655435 RepID=A0A4Z1E8Q5_9MICO|nr:hypothetical protein [Serinibacter arcticus]TGO05957.1 hypothetical protein SERN_0149 [Serinibacter arcticus]
MPAVAATLVVLFAVVIAAGTVAVMLVSARPEAGYRAWLRDVLRPGADAGGRDRSHHSRPMGAVAEMRDAAEGETVGLDDLLRDAERSDGYLTVPQRYEDRFEVLTEGLAARQRALADRRRDDRQERTNA